MNSDNRAWADSFRPDLTGRARVLAAIAAHREHGRYDIANEIESMLEDNVVRLIQPVPAPNSATA